MPMGNSGHRFFTATALLSLATLLHSGCTEEDRGGGELTIANVTVTGQLGSPPGDKAPATPGTLISSAAWGAPLTPSGRTLVRDLVKVVEIREQAGWGIDEYEFRDAVSTALRSVCRASEEARVGAREELKHRLMQQGGHPEGQLEQGRVSWGELKEVVTVWRAQELLERAIREIDYCPFWLQASPAFRGLHSDEGRFSLGAAGGGRSFYRRVWLCA